jgi:hypothetical protein
MLRPTGAHIVAIWHFILQWKVTKLVTSCVVVLEVTFVRPCVIHFSRFRSLLLQNHSMFKTVSLLILKMYWIISEPAWSLILGYMLNFTSRTTTHDVTSFVTFHCNMKCQMITIWKKIYIWRYVDLDRTGYAINWPLMTKRCKIGLVKENLMLHY